MTGHPAPPGPERSSDPRVYLDRQSGRWRYEDDDGDEWEWQPRAAPRPPPRETGAGEGEEEEPSSSSAAPSASSSAAPALQGAWIKVIDEDLINAQQAAYGEAAPEQTQAEAQPKKRKKPNSGSGTSEPPSKKPKPITSLYVSGLPLDCSADEIASVFSRYGLLLEDDEGKPRIKLYYDDATGQFKGEALVVYFKPESVELAINLLDDTHLRAALGQTSGPKMKVQLAQFPAADSSQKQPQQTGASSTTSNPAAGSGSGSGSRRNLTDHERKKIQKRVARMENKLTEWGSSDEDAATPTSKATSSAALPRTVVLKKMFTLIELDEDPTLLLDLKQDVREECESLGSVTNVVLWDKEPEGIMTVRFADPQSAQACIKKMDGRYFAGRRIDAFLLDGKPRFRKSDKHEQNDDEDEQRADAFGDWLESGAP